MHVSFFELFCCCLLVSDCRSWVWFHVICVVCLWFASPQYKMCIVSQGCKPQTYYTYNSGGKLQLV
jgi:hypothetical protein